MSAIRVAVIEEHEIFRRGLVSALTDAPGIDVAHESAGEPVTGEVDVVVASPASRSSVAPGGRIVLCVTEAERSGTAMGGDVHGLLPRADLTPEQLVAAVQAAAQGLRLELAARPEVDEIDERSRAVLALLAAGAQTRDISSELGYSERTIKSIIQDVERRLGARSRAQAVAVGIRRGLI